MWRRVLGGPRMRVHLSAASVVPSVLVSVAVFAIDIAGVAFKLAFHHHFTFSFACHHITRAFVVSPQILISNIGSRRT